MCMVLAIRTIDMRLGTYNMLCIKMALIDMDS